MHFTHSAPGEHGKEHPHARYNSVSSESMPVPVETGRFGNGSVTSAEVLSKPSPPRTTSSSSPTNGVGQAAHATPPPSPVSSSRRPSWLTNISSKFSSSAATVETNPSAAPSVPAPAPESPESRRNQSGFLLSTLRRLSSGSNARDVFGRRSLTPMVGMSERVILNKDLSRERCCIPGLDGSKLRRVAFCVDVEVAPSHEDVEAHKESRRKRKEARGKEKKNLKAVGLNGGGAADVESDKEMASKERKEESPDKRNETIRPDRKTDEPGNNASASAGQATDNGAALTGSVPSTDTEKRHKSRRRGHPKATTDPLKIYTQCCQLRETAIVPEIKERLLKESGAVILRDLDLTGYKFRIADVVTFSDFLALVPIKRLILEDCDLTDEMLRVILSALSAVKPLPSLMHHSKHKQVEVAKQMSTDPTAEKPQRGAVERLSLKNNRRTGRDGWRFISCFVHMSHSLKALDLSGLTLPRSAPTKEPPPKDLSSNDAMTIFSKALGQRLCGHGLEELVMGHCDLNSAQLQCLLHGLAAGGTKRLGLEGNTLKDDGLAMLGQWVKGKDKNGAGLCEVLDLSNNDLQGDIEILSTSFNELSSLCALSLSNCNLSPASLSSLLPALASLPHFKWLNLSNNPLLFSSQPDSLTLLRKYLTKMHALRKIDLANTSMTSDHAIALCEILPEVKQLAYFNLSGNPLVQSGHGKVDEGYMEEGAALYTALMAAVKVSQTIVRIDIDEPGLAAGNVIHGLAQRLLDYCLRNIEAGAIDEDWTAKIPEISKETQHVQQSLPSPDECPLSNGWAHRELDDDQIWKDEESYVVGGTGVVKALGVCLGNKPQHARGAPTNVTTLQRSATNSSAGSLDGEDYGSEKANEMSKALLGRARDIKQRIQPALRKGYSGELEEHQYKRLQFLDETLYRVIRRFEEEYPECRQHFAAINGPSTPPPLAPGLSMDEDQEEVDGSPLSSSTTGITRDPTHRGSEVSLHSKYLQNEEGQMHKLGQYIQNEILSGTPQPTDFEATDGEGDDVERAEHRERIMRVVETIPGEELRRQVMEHEGGVEGYIEKIGGQKRNSRLWRNENGLGTPGAGGVVLNTAPTPVAEGTS